jgi:hypothetical protein
MSQFSDHGIHDGDVQADEEYELPCSEALLAGTLALMTGHAQACCGPHRERMAEKAAASLLTLSQHPLMSPGFRSLAWSLHGRWMLQSQADQAHAPQVSPPAHATHPNPSQILWHTASEVIQ